MRGITRVFHEDQEGGNIGHEPTVQGHATAHGGHGELTHAVIEVVTIGILGRDRLAASPDRVVRPGQVGGAAQQLRERRTKGVQGILGGLSSRDAFPGFLALADVGIGHFSEIRRQVTREATLEFRRQFRVRLFVIIEKCLPLFLGTGPFSRASQAPRMSSGTSNAP